MSATATPRPAARRTSVHRLLVGTLAAALGLATSACITVGQPFPEQSVSLIEPGRTNQQEIHQVFGTPWRKGIEDGDRTWTYGHYRYGLFRSAETSDLVVRFDRDGLVSSYSYNTTRPKAR